VLLAAAALIAAVLTSTAGAASTRPITAFRSASGAIHCSVLVVRGSSEVRCAYPAKGHSSWTYWSVGETGSAHRSKSDDWPDVGSAPRLARNKTFAFSAGKSYNGPQDSGINCTGTASGLKCTNDGGHGFELGRTTQRIFDN
jgi:hypothetical protein